MYEVNCSPAEERKLICYSAILLFADQRLPAEKMAADFHICYLQIRNRRQRVRKPTAKLLFPDQWFPAEAAATDVVTLAIMAA